MVNCIVKSPEVDTPEIVSDAVNPVPCIESFLKINSVTASVPWLNDDTLIICAVVPDEAPVTSWPTISAGIAP